MITFTVSCAGLHGSKRLRETANLTAKRRLLMTKDRFTIKIARYLLKKSVMFLKKLVMFLPKSCRSFLLPCLPVNNI